MSHATIVWISEVAERRKPSLSASRLRDERHLGQVEPLTQEVDADEHAADAIAAETVRIVKVFLETGRPAGTVNLCADSKATHRLVVKCLDHVDVVGQGILDRLHEEGVNVEDMENTVFAAPFTCILPAASTEPRATSSSMPCAAAKTS